jgi:hypothetical protein
MPAPTNRSFPMRCYCRGGPTTHASYHSKGISAAGIAGREGRPRSTWNCGHVTEFHKVRNMAGGTIASTTERPSPLRSNAAMEAAANSLAGSAGTISSSGRFRCLFNGDKRKSSIVASAWVSCKKQNVSYLGGALYKKAVSMKKDILLLTRG